jgi:3-hydroxyacyl-CoA dehydrogenase
MPPTASAAAVRLERDGDVAHLVVDHPPVNAASHAVRAGLVEQLHVAIADPTVRAVVLRCAGRTFVAGADITEFGRPPRDPWLPTVCDALEDSPKPVVAALHGTALGGGLELALACHGRIALASAKVGLPEVKLGLIPGAGGTQRLPRLVGAERALAIMLSGEPATAHAAREAGLVDAVVDEPVAGAEDDRPGTPHRPPADLLAAAASALARRLADAGAPRRTRERAVDPASVPAGGLVDLQARAAAVARGQTAPARIAEAVHAAATQPFEAGMAVERRLFEASRNDPQSRALRHLFFAERAAGKLDTPAEPIDVRRIAVIGAGTMGSGIALACLEAGYEVVLVDADAAALDRGAERVRSTLDAAVAKGRLARATADERLVRLRTAASLRAAADCDLAIEAVFENLDLKRRVFAELDAVVRPGALLATNTSYLDVDAIAGATQRAPDVLGLHFFSPAHVMKLVEVVRGRETSRTALATGVAVAKRLGKWPIVTANATGFVGNRMLQAYGRENQLLLLEGATPWQVDAALERFGMAMGPNAVLDLAGLDVGWRARRERKDLPNDPRYFRVADALVEAGRLGQKSGRGSYRYDANGRSRTPDPEVEALIVAESAKLGIARRAIQDDEIVERCVHALINEGARLLDEGVTARASDVDVAWVHGYGFPRWRGGPLQYADELGLREVLATVERLRATHGDLYWRPAASLVRLATSGGTFAAHARTP